MSSADYISNVDAEFSKKPPISHTPIFSHSLMSFFTREEHRGKHFQLLDMTFGSGSHTCYILDQFRRAGVEGTLTVYASDCDPEAYDLARRVISERAYDSKMLVPIKSSFVDLEAKLQEKHVEPGSLSGILIDTGISSLQWANQNRGFCHLRDGILDLRFDPFQNIPRGYQVLQNIDESSLTKLLRTYGSVRKHAKHITAAILEARYMNYDFKSVNELREVMETAVKHASKMPGSEDVTDPKMVTEFTMRTIVALRAFVNDELNQLDYAIRYLAKKYLKVNGILAVITHNEAEGKVVNTCFKEIWLDSHVQSNFEATKQQIDELQHQNPWKMLFDPAMALPMAEQILYPRLKDSVLFAAERIH